MKLHAPLLTLCLFAAPALALAAATPPPSPPPPNATAAPTLPPGFILPTPGAAHPKPTPTPPPAKGDEHRVGISGVWEVQVQRTSDGQTVYEHFKLTQNGSTLVGTYLDASGKRYPLAGSIDGKTVRIVVSMPNGTAMIFSGAEDAGTDMLGMVETPKGTNGFTATYRPKYKWIENIAPGASGMGVPY